MKTKESAKGKTGKGNREATVPFAAGGDEYVSYDGLVDELEKSYWTNEKEEWVREYEKKKRKEKRVIMIISWVKTILGFVFLYLAVTDSAWWLLGFIAVV